MQGVQETTQYAGTVFASEWLSYPSFAASLDTVKYVEVYCVPPNLSGRHVIKVFGVSGKTYLVKWQDDGCVIPECFRGSNEFVHEEGHYNHMRIVRKDGLKKKL